MTKTIQTIAATAIIAAVFNRALDEDADAHAIAEETGATYEQVLAVFDSVLAADRNEGQAFFVAKLVDSEGHHASEEIWCEPGVPVDLRPEALADTARQALEYISAEYTETDGRTLLLYGPFRALEPVAAFKADEDGEPTACPIPAPEDRGGWP